jgi:hypothetical protein
MWHLTESGVLCNLDRMTHIMPAKTELGEQAEGRKPWQVVAMFPVGGVQNPQMHIPLHDCDTKEEAEEWIANFAVQPSLH